MKGSSSEAIQTSKLTSETTDESEICTFDNLYLRQAFSHSLNAGIQKVKWPISRVRHKFEPVRKLGGRSKSMKNCWGTCRRARGLGLAYRCAYLDLPPTTASVGQCMDLAMMRDVSPCG